MPEDKVEVRINQAINFIESHELCPTTFKPLQLTRSGVSQAAHLAAARLQRLEAFAQGCSRRRGPGLLSPARARRVLLARASAGRRRFPPARPPRPPGCAALSRRAPVRPRTVLACVGAFTALECKLNNFPGRVDSAPPLDDAARRDDAAPPLDDAARPR